MKLLLDEEKIHLQKHKFVLKDQPWVVAATIQAVVCFGV
jgi:hypothetical protein